jgi:cell division protein FtsB
MKKEQTLSCSNCGKEYKTTSGRRKHEKTCKVATRASIMNVLTSNKELSQLLVKHQVENQQTQERLLDHIKEQQKQIEELKAKLGN